MTIGIGPWDISLGIFGPIVIIIIIVIVVWKIRKDK